MDSPLKTIKISHEFLSLYFIIITQKSNYRTMVKAIRNNENSAQIVLLTSDVELLGIIDLSSNYSYTTLLELIKGYIDDFIEIKSE